jgi:ribonuclease P protein component
MRTLTSATEIDRLFAEGRRASSPILLVLAVETPEARGSEGRVLFVAGRRLGGAVERNRAKRVLREAARRAGAPWAGFDVALVARPATGRATSDELDRSLARALSILGVRP